MVENKELSEKLEKILEEIKKAEVKEVPEKIPFREKYGPVSDWVKHFAIFFDKNGDYVGKKKLKYSEKTFTYKGSQYIFEPRKSSFLHLGFIFNEKKYHIYTLNNPLPQKLKETLAPVIGAKELKDVLDSDLVQKLNEMGNRSLWKKLFTIRGLIILLIIGALIYYYASGGTLTK